jgi:hypothetical protein
MATEQDIKNTILRIAGEPSSGVIKDLAPAMAKAIAELDEDKREAKKPQREIRVTEATETR